MCLLGDMSWKEWPFPVGAGHVPVPPRLFWGRYCGGDAALFYFAGKQRTCQGESTRCLPETSLQALPHSPSVQVC